MDACIVLVDIRNMDVEEKISQMQVMRTPADEKHVENCVGEFGCLGIEGIAC